MPENKEQKWKMYMRARIEDAFSTNIIPLFTADGGNKATSKYGEWTCAAKFSNRDGIEQETSSSSLAYKIYDGDTFGLSVGSGFNGVAHYIHSYIYLPSGFAICPSEIYIRANDVESLNVYGKTLTDNNIRTNILSVPRNGNKLYTLDTVYQVDTEQYFTAFKITMMSDESGNAINNALRNVGINKGIIKKIIKG